MRITAFLLFFTLISTSSAFSISPALADFLPEFLKPAVVENKPLPSAPETSEEVVVDAELPKSVESTGEAKIAVLPHEAKPLDENNSAHGSLNDVMPSAKFDLKKIIEERRAQLLERKASLKGALPISKPASPEEPLNDVIASAASKFDLKKIIEERRAQILERKAALKGALPNPIPEPASIEQQSLNDVIASAASKFDLKKIIEERRAQILERKAALKGGLPIPKPSSTEESLNDEVPASRGAVIDFKKLIEERRAEFLKRINAQKADAQPLDDSIPSAHFSLKEIIERRRAEILNFKAAQQSLVQPQQDIERTMPLRPLKNKSSQPINVENQAI